MKKNSTLNEITLIVYSVRRKNCDTESSLSFSHRESFPFSPKWNGRMFSGANQFSSTFQIEFFTQSGHRKTENPLITFPNKIMKNLKKKTCVCKRLLFNIIQSFSGQLVLSKILSHFSRSGHTFAYSFR